MQIKKGNLKMSKSIRCLLVHQGAMENYGLMFVAGELKRLDCTIRWIDGDIDPFPVQEAEKFNPDYIFFSPMTFSFNQALSLAKIIKNAVPETKCIFGGHHVSAVPEDAKNEMIDYAVLGPVYGTLEKIFSGTEDKILRGRQGEKAELKPAKNEYYQDIPSITKLPKRFIMSHFGCPYNCSYCSAPKARSVYSPKEYKRMFLTRRPPKDVIEESKIFLKYPPMEVFLADDDCLQGDDAELWLEEFAALWKKEIKLPITTYVSPFSINRASDNLMRIVASIFPFINMGVQSFDRKTLELYKRAFQTEEIIRKAVDRLREFGIRGTLELIIGAPCDDPIEEALSSYQKMQEIAPDFYCNAYPLIVFPGTDLRKYLLEKNIPFNDLTSGSRIHEGFTSIKFDKDTMEKIRTLSKFSNFFVSHKVDIHYMRALLEVIVGDRAAFAIAKANFILAQKYKFNEGESFAEERMKAMRQFFY